MRSLNLVSTGTKDEKAMRLWNHWKGTQTDVDKGTQSASETKFPVASGGSMSRIPGLEGRESTCKRR